MFNNHFFHLVSVSPWPLVSSLGILNLGLSMIMYIYDMNLFFFFFSFFIMLLIFYQWWRDVICESLYEGSHSIMSVKGMDLGVFGFIISELFFFVSFFWMYFYLSLSPDFSLGLCWPPAGITSVNFLDIPFFNTLILLSSGFFITWAHYMMSLNLAFLFYLSYFFSVCLGGYFILVQAFEYYEVEYDFSDGGYGCSFFILTGFHGFHVFVGLIFLLLNLFRFMSGHFSFFSYSGFEYSVWYWHFVDVVWLFLYIFIYWWGG